MARKWKERKLKQDQQHHLEIRFCEKSKQNELVTSKYHRWFKTVWTVRADLHSKTLSMWLFQVNQPYTLPVIVLYNMKKCCGILQISCLKTLRQLLSRTCSKCLIEVLQSNLFAIDTRGPELSICITKESIL